ncbi:MAG: glutamine-hydrolyzing GMP synthase [Weeksellaceae bacterium]
MILILDFGSQSTHLISRRLRELSIETYIMPPEDAVEELKTGKYKGIILSGGPASVYEDGAPTMDKTIFEMGIPLLGICYGEQLMAHLMQGEVKSGLKKEYGPAILEIKKASPLFHFPDAEITTLNVWMSHGDDVVAPPAGFESIAVTETIPHAAVADEARKLYGIQFHPEVVHTQFGLQILENFARICGLNPKEQPITEEFVNNIIADIKDSVKDTPVVGALSGGVDSSIACLLVYKAIGDQFTPIYIDSGLMRQDETKELEEVFGKNYDMKVTIVKAEDRFIDNLKGVTDPETKRKIIGRTFIEILDEEAQKRNATFLVQGTIYPDVIESAGTKHSKNIKSHHNVGGLPADMKLTLLEPLRNFYKDEVRKIGSILKLPEAITHRYPFPGPGLAIRMIGEVTKEKLSTLRKSDAIVQEELSKIEKPANLWQMFAIHTGIKTTGVRGDDRAYGDTIAIRAIDAVDAMSGNFSQLPWEFLEKISIRIVTEVVEVNRVVYDITNKPPATIEWE